MSRKGPRKALLPPMNPPQTQPMPRPPSSAPPLPRSAPPSPRSAPPGLFPRREARQSGQDSLQHIPPIRPPDLLLARASDVPTPILSEDEPTSDGELSEHYLAHREQLLKGELDAASKFDQYLITLSSSAIGLSILYLGQVAQNPSEDAIGLLVKSWFLFTCTLIAMLVLFLVTQNAWELERKICDLEEYKRAKQPIPGYLSSLNQKENWRVNTPARSIKWINYCSLAFFLAGIICFLGFVRSNPPSTKGMQPMTARDTTNGSPQREEKSAPPPSAPVRIPGPSGPQTSPKQAPSAPSGPIKK
jgi:hypothetical protein